jgi:hypothetical protein
MSSKLMRCFFQSPEYSSLRGLSTAADQLHTLLTEQTRLTKLFWLSQIPAAGQDTAQTSAKQVRCGTYQALLL